MKQTVQKVIKNETFVAVLLILFTTLITYGSSIPNLGYYHDDWYLLWSGQARGAQSIIPLFSTDRPFMGVIYSLVYRLLGDSILNWHLYALLWRFIGGLAFFWILRMIWPENKYITTMIAVLFIIYPGFLSQPNANTKQNQLYGFGTALLSIALMLQAVKIKRKIWKLTFFLLSILLAINYLFIYEYMIGLEGMRLVLLGYLLFQQGFTKIRTLTKETFKKWWPFSIAMAGFLYWRIFVFDSSRNATDASKLAGDYIGNLRNMSLRLFFETAKDFLDTTVFAWAVKPYQLFANAQYSTMAVAILIAGVVVALVLIYSFFFNKWWAVNDNDEAKTPMRVKEFVLMGVFITVCAIFPVVLSGRNVELTDAYKSYGLHPIGGVVMLLAGIVLMLRPNFRKWMLVVLIGISVSTQLLNASEWQQLWDYQRETWWQLTWRAPGIKDDTLVIAYFPDGYRLQQDYEIWGPVDLIYRPGPAKAPAIQAEVLTPDVAYDIVKRVVRDNFDRDIKLHRNFNNLLLISLASSSSCIHIIDGSLPVYSENDALLLQQVGAYSHVDRIIPTGTAPAPSGRIFGAEPAHDWCYYYQKAALARQTGNWEEIDTLYAQAVADGFRPADESELVPFVEALINLGKYDQAKAIYNKEIKGRGKMRLPLCESLSKDPNYPPGFRYDYKNINQILCLS